MDALAKPLGEIWKHWTQSREYLVEGGCEMDELTIETSRIWVTAGTIILPELLNWTS